MKKFLSGLVFFFKEWFRPMPRNHDEYHSVREEARKEKRELHEYFEENPMAEEAGQDPARAGDIASRGDTAMSRMLEDASGSKSSGSCSHRTK